MRDLSAAAAAAALHCVLPSILLANLSADYTERRCHRVRDFVPLVVAEIPHAVAALPDCWCTFALMHNIIILTIVHVLIDNTSKIHCSLLDVNLYY